MALTVVLVVVAGVAVGARIGWGLIRGEGQSIPAAGADASPAAASAAPAADAVPGQAPSAGSLSTDSTLVPGALAPEVREVAPPDGSVNGGEAVVLTGSGFVDGIGVLIGGRAASDVTVLNDGTVRAVIPPGLPGEAPLALIGPDGVVVEQDVAFAYVDRPPRVVMAVRPAVGRTAGGTAITIVGTGFEPGARVVLGGERATSVDVLDATRITAVAPAHEEGVVDVVVRNPGMPAAILPVAFVYVAAPSIEAVAPAEIPASGGVRITVTGTGFEPGASVTLDGVPALDVQVAGATRLTALAPPGATGPAVIVVENPEQPAAVLDGAVRYASPVPSPAVSPAVPSPAVSPAPVPGPTPPPVPGSTPAPAG